MRLSIRTHERTGYFEAEVSCTSAGETISVKAEHPISSEAAAGAALELLGRKVFNRALEVKMLGYATTE